MTARVVEGERSEAPPVLPGVASLAIAPSLEGPPRPAEILGAGGPAAWIGEPDGVLVVTTGGAVRLPNGIHVVGTGPDPFRGLRPGDPASIGGGMVRLGSVAVRAARWWDPVPPMPAVSPEILDAGVAVLAAVVPTEVDHGLAAALAGGDVEAAFEAARRSIGLGDGLTPRGDDLVAGTVSAFLLAGRALGDGRVPGIVDGLAVGVLEHAVAATTAFSATLLAHAFRGEVAAPAGALLRALANGDGIEEAASSLLAVGHSSGPALAAGVLGGVRAAIERSV